MNTHHDTTTAAGHTAICKAAAEALVANLPTTGAVTVALLAQAPMIDDSVESTRALSFSFVGQTSANLVLQLRNEVLDGAGAQAASGVISVMDILRPGIEAATGVLGTGVISPAKEETANALLTDPSTLNYQLSIDGSEVGFFAIRLGSTSAPQEVVNASISEAVFPEGADPAHVGSRLSRLRNVQMGLTVEIGRARVSVRDVLNLEPGAVIELDRNAGAPADVRLNGRLIAQGEVVVMDQEYGVRITKILDSSDSAA